MSNYPAPPPAYPSSSAPKGQAAYGSTASASGSSPAEPLLASGSRANEWGSGTDNDDDDIPEDFKIGTTVGQSHADVRAAFVRKV